MTRSLWRRRSRLRIPSCLHRLTLDFSPGCLRFWSLESGVWRTDGRLFRTTTHSGFPLFIFPPHGTRTTAENPYYYDYYYCYYCYSDIQRTPHNAVLLPGRLYAPTLLHNARCPAESLVVPPANQRLPGGVIVGYGGRRFLVQCLIIRVLSWSKKVYQDGRPSKVIVLS